MSLQGHTLFLGGFVIYLNIFAKAEQIVFLHASLYIEGENRKISQIGTNRSFECMFIGRKGGRWMENNFCKLSQKAILYAFFICRGVTYVTWQKNIKKILKVISQTHLGTGVKLTLSNICAIILQRQDQAPRLPSRWKCAHRLTLSGDSGTVRIRERGSSGP